MKKNLDSLLFEKIVILKSTTGSELLLHFPDYTKQGLYKALRRLRSEGKILWQNKTISVNLLFASQQIESLSTLFDSQLYSTPVKNKRQTYRATTLDGLDTLYSQLFITLTRSNSNSNTSYLFYDLHNYTYLHKKPLVDWYINRITKDGNNIKLLIGSLSPLDKAITKEMNNLEFHHTNKKWSYFITVIGDLIIENHLDKKVTNMIDSVFENNDIKTAQGSIKNISQIRGSFKIIVERNERKTKEVRSIFSKYFKL